jgi:hypothetical protein
MSNWYLPPCRDASIGKFAGKYTIGTTQTNDGNSWPILNVSDPWESVSNKSNMMIDSTVLDNRKILLHRATIEDCGHSEEQYEREGKRFTESRVTRRWFMFSYCSEVVELIDIMEQIDRGEDGGTTPILAFFGDFTGLDDPNNSFQVPFIAKHRAATTKDFLSQVTGNNVSKESCWKEARSPLKTAYHQNIYSNKFSPILWRMNPIVIGTYCPWRWKMIGLGKKRKALLFILEI